MMFPRGLRLGALALCLAAAACTSTKTRVDEPVTPESGAARPAAPAPLASTVGTDAASTSAAAADANLSANALTGSKASGRDKAGSGGSADGSTMPDAMLIHFAYDSDAISADDSQILAAHAAYLKVHAKARVRLEGHADERGTQEYNMALGERRAKAARFFLVSHGARVSQIEVISYGKTKPLDSASTEAAWATNRRVEVVYR